MIKFARYITSPSAITLIGRIVFVATKPVSLVLSALVVGSDNLQLFTLVLASLPTVTAFLSLPVHRSLYLGIAKSSKKIAELESSYASSILIILAIAYPVLFVLFAVYSLETGLITAAIIPLIYLQDKVFDELMRMQQFNRSFYLWLVAGCLRNFWCYVFVFFLWIGVGSGNALSLAISLNLILSIPFYVRHNILTTGLNISFYKGVLLIKGSISYFLAGFYDSLLRNIDKILVSLFVLPSSAYIVAFSMFAGALFLISDSVIIAPRRKLISRYPLLYLKLISPLLNRAGLILFSLLVVATAVVILLTPYSYYSIIGFLILTSTLVGVYNAPIRESLFWLLDGSRYMRVYIVQAIIMGIVTGLAGLVGMRTGKSYIPFVVPLVCSFFYLFHVTYIVKKAKGSRESNPLGESA